MKNLKLILLAIVIVIFFTRCEKESYIEDSIIVVDTISNVDTTPITPVVKIPNPLGSLKSSSLKVTDGGGVTDIDGNDETFKYNGILYNWYAVSNGIAPDGWHVATRDDWDNLYRYCKNNDITFSSSIKEYSGLDRWGAFGYNENYYHWWTGDGVNATIDSGGEISTFGSNSPRTGFSVICVKNK